MPRPPPGNMAGRITGAVLRTPDASDMHTQQGTAHRASDRISNCG